MESVIKARTTGKQMVCADSMRRNVWPIFAVYVADYPEQCLSPAAKKTAAQSALSSRTSMGITKSIHFEMYRNIVFHAAPTGGSERHGLRGAWHLRLFYSHLLPQLHKGVFKDHLVKWCTEIIGKLDKGISMVSQWTGTEHKEMEKVFLGIVTAGAHPQMVTAVRSLIDFAYFASLQSHTSDTLLGMCTALDTFHANKQIFIELGGCRENFNIPKVHSLDHYAYLIWLFGSADGFNTESPERLHIDYAKNRSCGSFSAYLDWAHLAAPPPATSIPPPQPSTSASSLSVPLTSNTPPTDTLTISHTYSMAKVPPPATRAVAASHIISPAGRNASRFIPALSTFLRASLDDFHASGIRRLRDMGRITFKLPTIPEVGAHHSSKLFTLLHLYSDLPGSKDPDSKNPVEVSTTPLAYIEWFTPL
ncbi:hypothetical protein B0H10DRAFT_2227125 [Mycena sp. CBHHK59/15]|nr:hypothetical protein B0H10DRAFT_2227125 [Mycena sp. CBHHK59/15]